MGMNRPTADMCNIYLEEGSKYVNSVPEKEKETSDEKPVLCLVCSYLFLKEKNQNSTKLFGATNQYFKNFS